MNQQLELFPDLTSGEKELWEFARWVITEGPFREWISMGVHPQGGGLV
jgi:hypothetical protein